MPKVIQNIKLNLTKILHRGHEEYSSDPYSNNLKKATYGKFVGRSKQTLGTNKSSTRCSSTLQKYINNSKRLRIAGVTASFTLTIISALTIYPIVHSATTAEAIAGSATAATTTLEMTTDFENASLSLLVTDQNGTFASSTDQDQAKFSITTNNFTGYTLSISADDDDGHLSISGSDQTLDSIEYPTLESAFSTTTFYNGKWGYFPSKYNSSTNIYFRPAPTTSASTLDVTTAANNESNSYTIGLGARADYATPNGEYTNTYTLTVVGNPAAYAITYADDSGDTVTDLPAATTGNTTDTTVKLTTDAPIREKYTLVSWCLGTVTDGGTVCDGTEYAPGADFGIDQTTTNITTLYAVWVESYQGYLQDFTAAQCAAMTVQSTVRLRDNRDNQNYIVAKLADGNCWMDNLNLGDTDNYPLVADLTSANTNLSETVEKATFNGWKKTSGSATYTAGEFIPISGTDSTSDTAYGTLYNYYAVSAGTISGDSGSANATHDICPKGWRLPTGDSDGEFQALYDNSNYNSYSSMRTSIADGGAAFALSGYFYNSAPLNKDVTASYWSSTRRSGIHMYDFYLNTSAVLTTSYDYSNRGQPVRCIKKDPLEEANLGTMQEIGKLSASEKSSLLASMVEGEAYTVSDSRDNQSYAIAKLADGNIWLLDNLRLGASTLVETLSTSNTNMSATIAFTLPSSSSSDFNKYDTAMINTASANTVNSDSSKNWGDGSHKYGVYYNYCAASAGTYCYAANAGTGNASYDVCPSGWRMPTGGDSSVYQALYAAYSSNNDSFRNALSIPLSGVFSGSSASYQGSQSYAWSSTRLNGYVMNILGIDSAGKVILTSDHRSRGFSVRCIMDNTMADAGVETLQDLGNLSVSEKTALLAKMPTGTPYTLTDSRDGQEYAVAKLADGNIWLLDNLRLGATDLKEQLSTTNTNMSSSVAFSLPSSTSTGFNSYTDAMINTSYANTTTTSYGVGSGKIGTYYNYCAASAGTYCYASGAGTGNANYDVCPSGWRMPTGGSTGEYQKLYTAYSSDATNFRNSLSTPLAGYFYENSAYAIGTSNDIWSSTYHNDVGMYYLFIGSTTVNAQNTGARNFGKSVRCVVKGALESVSTMQDVTAEIVTSAKVGDTATLTDIRDGQDYTVVKYGNLLWMTRNLAIGCNGTGSTYGSSISSKVLTSTDSNVSTAWSTPTASLTLGNSYDEARMACSSTYGAWYNYAAASAGTITGSSNTAEAQYSICPSGWRLFTSAEKETSSAFRNVFNPVTGGNYGDGAIIRPDLGHMWLSTVDSTTNRIGLHYTGDGLGTGSYERYRGYYVRCVKSAS